MDIITYILAKKYTDNVVKDCGGHVVDAWKDDTEARITQLEGTGKVLTTVTSADAGKYLRVSADGSWKVAYVNKLGDIT